jgi:hypothetical protein
MIMIMMKRHNLTIFPWCGYLGEPGTSGRSRQAGHGLGFASAQVQCSAVQCSAVQCTGLGSASAQVLEVNHFLIHHLDSHPATSYDLSLKQIHSMMCHVRLPPDFFLNLFIPALPL